MEEIWKDVVGYEGLYQVSNLGRVRSAKKEIWLGHGKGFIKTFPEQIIA
nr:MAG TPA: NUMOD4 motif protein [Caudoviricetes sp.]